jgi:hypothetical protein
MKFDHIGNDTSHGPLPGVPACRAMVVVCGISCSKRLSTSTVSATSTWENSVGKGMGAPIRS